MARKSNASGRPDSESPLKFGRLKKPPTTLVGLGLNKLGREIPKNQNGFALLRIVGAETLGGTGLSGPVLWEGRVNRGGPDRLQERVLSRSASAHIEALGQNRELTIRMAMQAARAVEDGDGETNFYISNNLDKSIVKGLIYLVGEEETPSLLNSLVYKDQLAQEFLIMQMGWSPEFASKNSRLIMEFIAAVEADPNYAEKLLSGQGAPTEAPELYSQRPAGEDAISFYHRVWDRFAGRIFLDDLERLDPALVPAIRLRSHYMSTRKDPENAEKWQARNHLPPSRFKANPSPEAEDRRRAGRERHSRWVSRQAAPKPG